MNGELITLPEGQRAATLYCLLSSVCISLIIVQLELFRSRVLL